MINKTEQKVTATRVIAGWLAKKAAIGLAILVGTVAGVAAAWGLILLVTR